MSVLGWLIYSGYFHETLTFILATYKLRLPDSCFGSPLVNSLPKDLCMVGQIVRAQEMFAIIVN